MNRSNYISYGNTSPIYHRHYNSDLDRKYPPRINNKEYPILHSRNVDTILPQQHKLSIKPNFDHRDHRAIETIERNITQPNPTSTTSKNIYPAGNLNSIKGHSIVLRNRVSI